MMTGVFARAKALRLFPLLSAVLLLLGAASACTGEIGGTTPLNCPTGQTACGARCVDPTTDATSCGRCGASCGAGSLCDGGACTALCATGELACGGRCTALESDLDNCGTCGTACAAGQFCSDGLCGASCAFQQCPVAGRVQCADTSTNARHCGACGVACPAGESCVSGQCRLVCPASRSACAGQCVDVQNDARNCGTCGTACPAGDACIDGRCGCAEGSELCGGVCVEVRGNPSNCGSCGNVCGPDQICDVSSCRPRSAGCSSGLAACGASCIDTNTSLAHCGGCDRPCDANKLCTGGVCVCAAGKTACGTSCVELASDDANCGACGTACSGGRTCQQGSCNCPTGQTFCGTSCVDTRSSNDNCGACGTVCGGGKTCTAGACACPAGQLQCGELCVDTQTSDANCGACGQACSLGQACSAGACGGGGGLREDGCSGLAENISIAQVAAYQTVRIVLFQNGAEVPVASRNTDVVAGRDAMLRVLYTLGAGFAQRELSARVFVQNAGTIDMYFAKKTVTTSSQEASLDQSFQVAIPKDKITLATRYAVELVECGGTPSGGVQAPRVPATDGLNLGARQTGPLKIQIVPLQVGSMLPDTSEAGLAAYRDLLLATYPISELSFTVGQPLAVTNATDWSGNLDRVRSRRQMDAPAADVYYYGLLRPAATLREFCGGGCTTGIGFVPGGNGNNQAAQRVGMGIGFADAASAETMAHEVAHNHGRNHAPCGSGISGVDGAFPDPMGRVGVYGYDVRALRLIAPDRTDIMGYCQNKWFSDYTYDGILNRVATVNGAAPAQILGPLARYRVLLVEPLGPRWGIPIDEPSIAAGAPEPAEVLDVSGRVVASVTVYRTAIADLGAFSIEIPTPEPGWHSVRVAGAPAYPFGAPTLTPSP